MSDDKKAPNMVMSWDTLLGLAKTAKDRAASEGIEVCVVLGIGAWTLAREIFEDRLREPFVADVAVVDGCRMSCSFLVEPAQLMIMARSRTEREIPLVITMLANDTEIKSD